MIREYILKFAVLCLVLGPMAAQAIVLEYTGPTQNSGGHISGWVDITGTSTGTYEEGVGLTAFELTAYDGAGNWAFTFGSQDASYGTGGVAAYYTQGCIEVLENPDLCNYDDLIFDNYITLDGSGSVTNWQLYAENLSNWTHYHPSSDPGTYLPPYIYTIGNPTYGTSDSAYGTHELTISPYADGGSGEGQWTSAVAQVPEPATLALFGLGLAGIGFSRRRKA